MNIDTESMLSFKRNDVCTEEEVFYRRWDPPSGTAPKSIFHISHGMAEHSLRYDPIARMLADNGCVVFCADQRGHGRTGAATERLGHHPHGMELMISDVVYMLQKWKAEFPDIPVFLLGHSMGSVVASHAAMRHRVDSLILSGCPNLTAAGSTIYGFIVHSLKLHRSDGTSNIPLTLLFKKWDGQVASTGPENRFISSNLEKVHIYNKDDWCGHNITNILWSDMYDFMHSAFVKTKNRENNLKDTKIWLFAGNEDMCAGVDGTSLLHISKLLANYGARRPKITLYNGRHEVLNEIPEVAHQCMNDIVSWVNTALQESPLQEGISKL